VAVAFWIAKKHCPRTKQQGSMSLDQKTFWPTGIWSKNKVSKKFDGKMIVLNIHCVGRMTVSQMTVSQMSVSQKYVSQISVGQMSVSQMSVGQMIVGQMSVSKMVLD
jgi:hypothetical protein